MHLRTAFVTCAIALSVAGCAEPPQPPDHAAQQRLEQREASFLAALGALDLDATTAHFADDALLHVANMPAVRGRDDIGRFYGNVFRFMRASDATPEHRAVAAAGDMAYSTGRVSNTFAGADGTISYTGKYLLVWERRGEDWLISVYSVSNDAAEGTAG